MLEQASDALTAAFGDGSFLTTLRAADAAFAAVTVDVAATQTAIADAALEVIVTTPSPTSLLALTPAAPSTSSSSSDGCALYIAGPVVASRGNQVATVDSLQNYELTFTMELASDWSITGVRQSILHIGDSDNQRLPGIWFHLSLIHI